MNSNEFLKISQNLSLRKSPERRFPPNNYSSLDNSYSPNRKKMKYNCYPLKCYHCYCCHCYHNCLCPNFTSMNKFNNIKSPNQNKNINISPIVNTSYKTNINPNPSIQEENIYFTYERNQFNDFLTKIMEIESKIEGAKINLAQNPDFNCDDAFILFESNNKGYLDENDIKNCLNLLGVNITGKEVKILMKRFDLQKNGGINYADFFDMLVPFEKTYRMRVESRDPIGLDNFSSQTITRIRQLFNLIINFENEINDMKKLFGSLRLNLRDIFRIIDKQNKGYFSHDELVEYLENNGIKKNIRDIDVLFIRLDKKRKGKIYFSEIEDELQALY